MAQQDQNAASEALRQLRLKLKSKPPKSTPLSLPLAMSNGTAPHAHGTGGSGNCTCSRGGTAVAAPAAAPAASRSHSSGAHYEAPPPPSPTSSHLHSLAMSTVGIPPGPTSPRSPQQIREQMLAIEEGLRVVVVDSGGGAAPPGDDGYAKQLIAARKLRDLICTNRDELIHELLERSLVPSLMGWLHPQQRLEVQVEALWALTNFVAGASDHATALVKHGAVAALSRLLVSDSQDVSQQVVWLLGSLAGGGAPCRDAVLQGGVLAPLVDCLERHQGSKELLKIGAWALANMCDGQSQAQQEVQQVMPALSGLLQHPAADAETLSHSCWAVSHLCDGPGAHVKAVVEAGAVWRLVELLGHQSWRVVKPALRTIGNIVCAEDEVDYTQHVIDAGAVQCLRQLIGHAHREIQKEACWTLSNIAAGTVDQIQTVLDSGCMPMVISLTKAVKDQEVKTEACWVVLNATSCGSDNQIEYLVQLGCISVLADLLTESSMAMMALEGLERILQVGDRRDRRERALAAAMAAEARPDGGAHGDAAALALQQERQLACIGKGNPFAALVSAAKLEALEGSSSSSAIAKRASAVRKLYYVNCAICQKTFSRGSGETQFCEECQCDVCAGCDCKRFHLSYLQEQWGALDGREREAQEQQRLKKARKKKRAKEKERRAREDPPPRLAPQPSFGASSANSSHGNSSGASAEHPPSLCDDPPSPPAVRVHAGKRGAAGSPQPAGGGKGSSKGVAAVAAAAAGGEAEERSAKSGSPPMGRSGSGSSSSSSGGGGSARRDRSHSDGVHKGASADAAAGPSKRDQRDTYGENDSLVSFLQQTGSILALAQMMDEQDGYGTSPSPSPLSGGGGSGGGGGGGGGPSAKAPPRKGRGSGGGGGGGGDAPPAAPAKGGKGKAARGRRGSNGLAPAAHGARAQEQCA